jgi:hypothetical protein
MNNLMQKLVVLFICCSVLPLKARTYSTSFPLTESPISEGGNWINGKTVGIDWNHINTIPGFAFGTENGAGGYTDSTALLTGPWGPDQTVQATVHIAVSDTASNREVELRLRSSLSAHNCTGYEVTWSTVPGNRYGGIARWNGAVERSIR